MLFNLFASFFGRTGGRLALGALAVISLLLITLGSWWLYNHIYDSGYAEADQHWQTVTAEQEAQRWQAAFDALNNQARHLSRIQQAIDQRHKLTTTLNAQQSAATRKLTEEIRQYAQTANHTCDPSARRLQLIDEHINAANRYLKRLEKPDHSP